MLGRELRGIWLLNVQEQTDRSEVLEQSCPPATHSGKRRKWLEKTTAALWLCTLARTAY